MLFYVLIIRCNLHLLLEWIRDKIVFFCEIWFGI